MQHFWAKVMKTDGCWLWTASKSRYGYGKFAVRRRVQAAHRVSWELVNGPIPAGLFVLHRCDVPACVRPDHLFIGTAKDNTGDMLRKGRHRGWFNGKTCASNPSAALTQSEVDEIRDLYRSTRHLPPGHPDRMTIKRLREKYRVAHATVFNVIHCVTWKAA